MDRAALKTLLKRYGFDDTDPLNDWLNQGMYDFLTSSNWPWMRDSILLTVNLANTNTSTFPSSQWRKIDTVKVTNGGSQEPLEYLPWSEFERLPTSTTNKWPTYYSYPPGGSMNQISWWPTYNGQQTGGLVFRVVGTREPLAMTDDADEPDLVPPAFHMSIVYRAAAIALMAENEENRAETAQAQFDSDVARALSVYGGSMNSQGTSVIDVMGY